MIKIKGTSRKSFEINEEDKLGMKFGMLVEGHLHGVEYALEKYGYSEQRYYQLLKVYKENGAEGLRDKKRGSFKQPVRSKDVVNQIIRLRFLDPLSSAEVITQKMKQTGYKVSVRSVERTITEFGLQKKLIASIPKTNRK